MSVDDLTAQIRDELHRACWRVHVVGLGFVDPLDAVARGQLAAAARSLAAQLVDDNDDRVAAQTVIDMMCALWPHSAPEDCGHADWWRTPLGRACARSLGRDDAESVSQSVAAAMLGVTRGTVAQMMHRGTLDRHPDGGVLRASVLQRLGR